MFQTSKYNQRMVGKSQYNRSSQSTTNTDCYIKFNENSTPTVEQILSSRDDVIQVRRKAAGEIIRYLPKLRHDEILSRSQ